MANPYQAWIKSILKIREKGAALPLGGLTPPRRRRPRKYAPKALIFAPHPDDECIIGGLALRLMREQGMAVVNIAVTLGSNSERREARWRELSAACAYLGFALEAPGGRGLEGVTLAARMNDPAGWPAKVKAIADVLRLHQPGIIFFPHDDDWNQTHLGVHALITDALRSLPGFACQVVETEFWGAMRSPNMMIEIGPRDLADLVAALSFHEGEVRRNPYHVMLPAWMEDNVRRGAELVGGQGGQAPDMRFATLYRLRRWAGGGWQPAHHERLILRATDALTSLVEPA